MAKGKDNQKERNEARTKDVVKKSIDNSIAKYLPKGLKNNFADLIYYTKTKAGKESEEGKKLSAVIASIVDLKDKVVGELKDLGSDLSRTLQGYFRDITSPISNILAPIMMVGATLWKIFKLIKNRMTGDKKGIFDQIKEFLTNSAMIIGVVIGATLGLIWNKLKAPFELIKGGLSMFGGLFEGEGVLARVGGFFKGLIAVFKESNLIGAGLEMVSGGFSKVGKLVSWFVDIFKALPFIDTLIGGMKLGFGWAEKLFWPLQIIMSLIDFIKGFMSSDGDIIDKIKGGLKQVFKGLVEPFIWLANFIGKIFGVDNFTGWISDTIKSSTLIPQLVKDGLMKALSLTGVGGDTGGTLPYTQANVDAARARFMATESVGTTTPATAGAPPSGGTGGGLPDMSSTNTVNAPTASSYNTSTEAKKWFDEASATNTLLREWLSKNMNIGGGGGNISSSNNVNSSQNNAVQSENIPTDIENFGILLMNKTWGLS